MPKAVLVQSVDGQWLPALCYIASVLQPRAAEPASLERILRPARELGFPAWYLARLEAFMPR